MSEVNTQLTNNNALRNETEGALVADRVGERDLTVVRFLDGEVEKKADPSPEKQPVKDEEAKTEPFEYCDSTPLAADGEAFVVRFKEDARAFVASENSVNIENTTICETCDASVGGKDETPKDAAQDENPAELSTVTAIKSDTDSAIALEGAEEGSQPVSKKAVFKLTKPENFEELSQKMCCKRGRKLIYRPEEALFEATFTVLGTDKKNDEGIKVKDILEAEIKEGVKLGYIDKFDGLKTSEIKEEYENDTVYEYAEQEFRKMGVIADGQSVKVYVYDWDRVGMHHIGYIDNGQFAQALPYFVDKEKYSFDLCGIITGGKSKTVKKDANGKITIIKEKGDSLGVELDVTIVLRKD
ncbi:MAG: hypothetical protein ACI4M6_02010 [Christensenellaceae bacterium]